MGWKFNIVVYKVVAVKTHIYVLLTFDPEFLYKHVGTNVLISGIGSQPSLGLRVDVYLSSCFILYMCVTL